MTDERRLQDRLDALEMRIAYQDEAIEDLNGAIVAQWKHIDTLMHEVKRLRDGLDEARAAAGKGQPPEPPPPHY